MVRLATYRLAWLVDQGVTDVRREASMAKVQATEMVTRVVDRAIQMHGAAGISQWTPLADMYTDMRHLRFADGPDEVHHMVVGRAEVQKHGLW